MHTSSGASSGSGTLMPSAEIEEEFDLLSPAVEADQPGSKESSGVGLFECPFW
jgi:hypothetical protein